MKKCNSQKTIKSLANSKKKTNRNIPFPDRHADVIKNLNVVKMSANSATLQFRSKECILKLSYIDLEIRQNHIFSLQKSLQLLCMCNVLRDCILAKDLQNHPGIKRFS